MVYGAKFMAHLVSRDRAGYTRGLTKVAYLPIRSKQATQCPDPWEDPKSRTPKSGFQCYYGLDSRIYNPKVDLLLLDQPRGLCLHVMPAFSSPTVEILIESVESVPIMLLVSLCSALPCPRGGDNPRQSTCTIVEE